MTNILCGSLKLSHKALSFILYAHQVLSYKEQQPPHVIFKKGKLQKAFALWRFEDGAEPGLEAPPGTKPQIRSELGQGRYCRHHSRALAQTPANSTVSTGPWVLAMEPEFLLPWKPSRAPLLSCLSAQCLFLFCFRI